MSKEKMTHDAILIINEKKREVAIFIVITLVILVILVVFPIRLMALKIVQINSEIEGKRQIKEQLETKINNFAQLNTEYQEIREDLKDFPLVYPNQGDYSLFVANLDEICNANSFRLRSVNIGRERLRGEENPYEILDIWSANINVMGRRSDLVHLLEDIEAMPMFPTVRLLSYSNELDEDDFLTFNISIRLYGVDSPGIYIDI